jgi:hypothetical protein
VNGAVSTRKGNEATKRVGDKIAGLRCRFARLGSAGSRATGAAAMGDRRLLATYPKSRGLASRGALELCWNDRANRAHALVARLLLPQTAVLPGGVIDRGITGQA